MDLDEVTEELQHKADEAILLGQRVANDTIQAISRTEDVAAAGSSGTNPLNEVEAAHARLNGNTFGKCSACDERITADRLEFHPWTTTCVEQTQ